MLLLNSIRYMALLSLLFGDAAPAAVNKGRCVHSHRIAVRTPFSPVSRLAATR